MAHPYNDISFKSKETKNVVNKQLYGFGEVLNDSGRENTVQVTKYVMADPWHCTYGLVGYE